MDEQPAQRPFRLEEATIEELHAAICAGRTTCVAERDAVADRGAHPAQQLAFAVFQVLGDHRAMQVEIDRVDRPIRPQSGTISCPSACNACTAPAIGMLKPATASMSSGRAKRAARHRPARNPPRSP
jgi:hypothetical protein